MVETLSAATRAKIDATEDRANRIDALYQDLDSLLERMRSEANTPDLRSRELSLAITNVEQGQLWINALGTRLSREPL